MYTQTASHDDHHTPTGWKRWAYSTNHKEDHNKTMTGH